MLRINPQYLSQIESASDIEDLHGALQSAVELEHATLPPYLTAMFSLKPQTNQEIEKILKSIVIEEMLHMSIVCNVLNAIGGAPAINVEHFIPTYPGTLPMGIGEGLEVGLTKYDKAQVKDVFMVIEEPEDPIVFKIEKSLAVEEQAEFNTIGEFYAAIQAKILEVSPDHLPGDPARQFTSEFFSTAELFAIETKQQAIDALAIIIKQGEGTSTSPLDGDGEYAHYYRFEELFKGKRLLVDSGAPNGYSFTGAIIPFDPDDVYNFYPNTKAGMLDEGSEERRLINQFNFVYAKLLNGLHRTFNGEPGFFPNTLGLMYDLKLVAERLGSLDFPGKPGYTIGPSFEYVRVNI